MTFGAAANANCAPEAPFAVVDASFKSALASSSGAAEADFATAAAYLDAMEARFYVGGATNARLPKMLSGLAKRRAVVDRFHASGPAAAHLILRDMVAQGRLVLSNGMRADCLAHSNAAKASVVFDAPSSKDGIGGSERDAAARRLSPDETVKRAPLTVEDLLTNEYSYIALTASMLSLGLLAVSRRRRRHQRYHCAVVAEVVRRGAASRALIVNVSLGGAKIRVEDATATPDDAIAVRFDGDLDLPARVVWTNGELMGVQFRELLSNVEMRRVETIAGEGSGLHKA